MSDAATARRELWLAIAVGALACAVRAYYLARLGGQYHPDEVFQYLEPAHWKIYGYGHLAWEFEKGARNYALSGLYSHLLRAGDWLGLGRFELHRALWCFDALLTLFLVPAGWRLGQLLAPARCHVAWILALLGAVFPVFGYFSTFTLSELHALVLATWAHVLWLDLAAEGDPRRRRLLALSCGLLFGLACTIRYASAVLVVVAGVDVLLSPRRRQLLWFGAGFLAPLLFIGLVDWAEWERPFGSLREYLRVNIGENYAAGHGVEPWNFYLAQLYQIFGASSLAVGLGLLAAVAMRPRLTLAWLVPLASYSAFAHKELRFALPLLPLLLAAAVAGLDDVLGRVSRRWPATSARRCLTAAAGALLLWVLGSAFWAVQGWSRGSKRGYYAAQALVSERADASGLLVGTTTFYTGGYTLIHRNIPFEFFTWELAEHSLFNYAAISDVNQIKSMRARRDFELIGSSEGVYLFRRRR
ncbi:MAG: hypothetical protein JXR83_06555 [Deltaproteobacteria bacterium]|nr:hypothetical protein [Deltaproteobacteria bacterium]